MFRANTKQTFWRIGFAVLILGLARFAISCAHQAGDQPTYHQPKPTPPDQIAAVGMDVCTNCHAGQVAAWITGQHANLDPPGDLNSEGFPSYAMFSANDTCQLCHDQLGDGHRLVPGYTGNAPRPVIGCESCHGGGAEHYGVGPIPYPKPDYQRCGQCHNADLPGDHLHYHPNAANIVEDYESSKHFHSINQHTLVETAAAKSETVQVKALCSRCHTDDGFKLYVNTVLPTMSYDEITALLADEPPLENPDPVGCFTCHDPHTAIAGDLTDRKSVV
jgi:Zn finger protein HypA/HybF involved in hydrogenase expression